MNTIRSLFFTALLLMAMTGCASLPSDYNALDDNAVLNITDMLKRIENENLLFVGEGHEEMSDHIFQAEVIRHLHAKGRRVVVALEVFPRDWQPLLNSWGNGSIDEYNFGRECDKIWGDLFYYYGDLLRFSRDSGIPLFGISGPRGLINSVALHGPGVISRQPQATGFSGCSDDRDYERLMMSVDAMNVHETRMPFFCDAQRLSDTIMAENLAELIRNNRQSAVVVLTGAAHASKIAVPRILLRTQEVFYKVLLPASFENMLQGKVGKDLADYIWY